MAVGMEGEKSVESSNDLDRYRSMSPLLLLPLLLLLLLMLLMMMTMGSEVVSSSRCCFCFSSCHAIRRELN